MANPFPPPHAMFNGQYPQQPFFPPYNSSPQTPTSGPGAPFAQNLQQHQAFAGTATNAKRFEANSHAPSPPIPFQFPPNWNPEVLRHIATSNSLQFPPPPPPPPPPHLFPSSYAPSPQPAPANAAVQQQPFSTPSQLRLPFQQPTGAGRPFIFQQQDAPMDTEELESRQPQILAHNADSVSSGHSSQSKPSLPVMNGSVYGQWNTAAVDHNHTAPSVGSAKPESTHESLHEQAKAAVIECSPFGASYRFWLDNGIKPSVIDKLFAELDLERPQEPLRTVTRNQPSAITHVVSTDTAENAIPPIATPVPEQVDPAMERKDRIAKMLAARKAQSLASAMSSQSASPAPPETLSNSMPAKKASSPLPRTQNQQSLQLEIQEDATASQNLNTSTIQPVSANSLVANLPTPVREEMKQSGFSIPGLFMTSADSAENQLPPSPSAAAAKPSTKKQSQSPESRKRSADPLLAPNIPQAKRRTSQTIAVSEAISKAITPTTSTDVKAISPIDANMTGTKDATSTHAPEPPMQMPTTPSRTRVNQDRIKDRMAALKADLMRKSSRRKAIQEGMPVLDAEVEKTRARLVEQQSKLMTVRQTIEARHAALTQAREEESQLLSEVQRLEKQLKEGETGQEQFSTELNQLNASSPVVPPEAKSPRPSGTTIHGKNEQVGLPTETSTEGEVANENTEAPFMDETLPSGVPFVTADASNRPQHATLSGKQHPRSRHSSEQYVLDRQVSTEAAADVEDVSAHENDSIPHGTGVAGHIPTAVRDTVLADKMRSNDRSNGHEDTDENTEDRMSIDGADDYESSASVSMSDSGSEDYEPPADLSQEDAGNVDDNDDYEPADVTPYETYSEPDADDYEPTEQVLNLDVNEIAVANGTSGVLSSTAPLSPMQGQAQDFTLPSSPPTEAQNTPADSTRPASTDLDVISDRTTGGELTLQQASSLRDPVTVLTPPPKADGPNVSRYVPYQSPLSNLKSFRYHPSFNEHVKNGYRSLTYSNNIDPRKPLCPTELSGEMCTDVDCVDQHFGSMALSDDKILVQMSSANDIKDKDQRDSYLVGLKKVIAGLRGQGVKEFAEVAAALSKYRREWMQTQSGFTS